MACEEASGCSSGAENGDTEEEMSTDAIAHTDSTEHKDSAEQDGWTLVTNKHRH